MTPYGITRPQCVQQAMFVMLLQWRHNECDDVSNPQPHDCLLQRLFRCRSKKTSKLHVTGLCEGNSPVTGEFPAQRASNAENVSIWWRHHDQAVFTALFSQIWVGLSSHIAKIMLYHDKVMKPSLFSTGLNTSPRRIPYDQLDIKHDLMVSHFDKTRDWAWCIVIWNAPSYR